MGWLSFLSPPPPPPPRSPTYLYAFVILMIAHHVWEGYLKLRTRLRLLRQRGMPPAVREAIGEVCAQSFTALSSPNARSCTHAL